MSELPPARPLLSTGPDEGLVPGGVDAHGTRHDWAVARHSANDPRALQHSNVEFLDRTVRAVGAVHARPKVVSALGSPHDVRILLVDDSVLHRECLMGVLVAQPGVVGVGVAWDLTSMVAEVQATLPHVILLNMATRDSAMLLRQATKVSPNVRVVVVGVSEEDERNIVECAEAGAAGYHLRAESLDNLLVLIHKVAAGESSCSPEVSAILLRRLSSLASQRRQPTTRELPLTAREIQILRMLEAGLANRDIAERLCIAVHTVKNHVHSVLTKLGVNSRAEAAALARNILAGEDFSAY
ncbi:response regulator transcription factor [Mycolicibacterium sp. 018/SC-01/001]|nr:response regulator transcription factor [Mycolicibacterium sp. 018/SC-01/001]